MISNIKPIAHRKIRGPADYQRKWKDFLVDMNIEDHWLEKLNALNTLKLISICEGHADAGNRQLMRTRPHINLRLKPAYLPLLPNEFDAISHDLQERMIQLFGSHGTAATCEYSISLNSSPARQEIRRDFVVRIVAPIRRTSDEMDMETIGWFEKVIPAIQQLDNFILSNLKTA